MSVSSIDPAMTLRRGWLRRAVIASALIHLVIVLASRWTITSRRRGQVTTVDIDLAPPPPKAEKLNAEIAAAQQPPEPPAPPPVEPASTDVPPPTPEGEGPGARDAGVDAGPGDAAPLDAEPDDPVDARRRLRDAGAPPLDAEVPPLADAPLVAELGDAGVPPLDDAGLVAVAGDGGTAIALTDGGGAGDAGLVAVAGDGGAGTTATDPDPAGALGGIVSAGAAADLSPYVPDDHIVTALIRFDRLRGTEWQAPIEALFRPMPDYRAMFGTRTVAIGDHFDSMSISSARPRDATQTLLVLHATGGRAGMRRILEAPTPVTWSAAPIGLVGRRPKPQVPDDKRLFLGPALDWYLVVPPAAVPAALLTPIAGSPDTAVATAALPGWLGNVRTIERESGSNNTLTLTFASSGKRLDLPDLGLGVTTLPKPRKLSLSLELVAQGWLVRGNLRFANDAEAEEFKLALEGIRERIRESTLMRSVINKQLGGSKDVKAIDMVLGLTFERTGKRVAYATSMSIGNMRAMLAFAAVSLDDYFGGGP